jgi:hypothetical protein
VEAGGVSPRDSGSLRAAVPAAASGAAVDSFSNFHGYCCPAAFTRLAWGLGVSADFLLSIGRPIYGASRLVPSFCKKVPDLYLILISKSF